MKLLLSFSIFIFLVAAGASDAHAQRWGFPDPMRDEPPPRSLLESMEKMRIEDAKKEHAEMLKRSEEAMKLAADLEQQMAANGKLSETEREKLAEVEKLIKKIRSDLGARDGDPDEDDESETPSTVEDAVGSLKRSSASLYDELKNSSRFTVSVPAIQKTNSILKVTRFLRFAN